MNADFRDAQWQRDYEEALRMLNGGAVSRGLLPAPPVLKPLASFNVRQEAEQLGPVDPTLYESGAALREALLARTTIRRTERPGVKEVRYYGELIGRIAKNPY
jgi:hypothetical protein